MENMGRRKVADKTIEPLQVGLTTMTPATVTGGRAANTLGVIPIGNYKGVAAFLDLDKLANQPLILAEKQHTLDIVDHRNGFVSITVPIGTLVGHSITDEIEVPAGEVWYLCAHELRVHGDVALTAGDLLVNFLVSSFPKTAAGADKPYYDTTRELVALETVLDDPLDVTDQKLIPVGAVLVDTTPTVVKGEFLRDFRESDELNTELRLVGGDKLTLVATVQTATVAGAPIVVDLRVWGRVSKVLVA